MSEFEDRINENSTEFEKEFLKNYDGNLWTVLEKMKNWQPPKPQQSMPVVPECVAEFIDDTKGNLPLHGALFYIGGNTNNELYNWVFREANQNLFARAWLDGYTVEKPQLFYLKAKELLVVGDYDHVNDLWLDWNKNFTPKKQDAHQFTQEEIDDMDSERYEQVEVTE